MPEQKENEIESRLDTLGRLDAESSGRLRNVLALNACGGTADFKPAGEKDFRKVKKWLASDENPDVIVVTGIGNGRALKALLELQPKSCVSMILERQPQHAASFFLSYEIEKEIQSGAAKLVISESQSEIAEKFAALLDLPKKPVIRIFDQTGISPEDSEYHHNLLMQIRNDMRVSILNLSTLVNLGPLWQRNTLRNLPKLIENPGLNALADVFRGKPALVVAAGPSLNEAIKHIKPVRNKFVLISVGTALKPLRDAGIRPDLVVSVDASEKTLKQFNTRCDDLYLACSLIAHPDVITKFKGIFSGHGSANSIGKWATSLKMIDGTLYGGGTVSTTALDIARKLGCNPVVAVGLDLCLTDDGMTHACNTMYHNVKINPVNKSLLTVPGNYSERVLTTTQFRAYIDIIRDYARKYNNVRFINANCHGARIDSMELIPLERISTLGLDNLKAYEEIRSIHDTFTPRFNIAGVLDDINMAIDQLNDIMSDTTMAAMICNQLIALLRSPRKEDMATAEEKLKILQEIDWKIISTGSSSMLIDMSLRPVFFSIGAKSEKFEENYSSAVRENMKSRRLYAEVSLAAKWTRDLLTETRNQINTMKGNSAGTSKNLHAARNLHAA